MKVQISGIWFILNKQKLYILHRKKHFRKGLLHRILSQEGYLISDLRERELIHLHKESRTILWNLVN